MEVTCIGGEAATRETGLTDYYSTRASHCRQPTRLLVEKIKEKTPQCADLPGPALVAVGTFHYQASTFLKASLAEVLTGETKIALSVNDNTGAAVGSPCVVTDLEWAGFMRPRGASVELARRPVSGILVCGFGCFPWQIAGALHPRPARDFDPAFLPGVDFCRLKERYDGDSLCVEWLSTDG